MIPLDRKAGPPLQHRSRDPKTPTPDGPMPPATLFADIASELQHAIPEALIMNDLTGDWDNPPGNNPDDGARLQGSAT